MEGTEGERELTMVSIPCYKKTMEHEYPLLRDILLGMADIPVVYKKALSAKNNPGCMKQALSILRMLNNSLQNMVVQRMGRRSGDRRWKMQSTIGRPYMYTSATSGDITKGPIFMCRDEADWHRREWDFGTLVALCQLPVRRLVADATRSKAFKMEELLDFMGMRSLANVHTVDLVKALLATISVPVLCTELCSLHDRLDKPSFLDNASSVGMLHYLAAMIASRHTFFTADLPEMRPHEGSDDDSEPCNSCLEAIIDRLQQKRLIHAGLPQAMSDHEDFAAARGGWSRYKLLDTYASTNREVRAALCNELAGCRQGPSSSCRKLVKTRDFPDMSRSQPDFSLLGKMRDLMEAQGIDITRIARAYSVASDRDDVPDVMCVLEHVEKQGKLMNFVQDIYKQDEVLGIKLALVF